MFRQKQAGFTLLELLVVLLIIGLLAGFVGPRYFSQISNSKIQMTKAQIDAFEKGLDQYRIDVGQYPTTDQGLKALYSMPSAGVANWHGPYIQKAVPLDPWGNQYVYNSPGGANPDATKRDYDIISYGRDGAPGGSGEDADITSY